ncbi:MAG: Gfo/Idh/MocA family oxidoreductase [Gemmataceae bacterium]|nr:Gfo/Idh/MocA family oxidoreductase [Gemmataceae bacterium]
MARVNRRRFLKQLAAAATITIAGTKSSGRVLGANEVIRVGVAGINGRGGAHIDAYLKMKDVQITYLIDPDTRTFGKYTKRFETAGNKPKTVQDVREALKDKELDAISIATPNHWHSLMTIWGCEAGKDVYVEKPMSHNVHEGRIAVETARKYKRIVQHGTQSRSGNMGAKIAQLAKDGTFGKLLVTRGLCYKLRPSIGNKPTGTPPQQVDFNLWLGPAREQPFHANLVHYNWHWFWDFGNGDIGNQGVHEMDIARWAIPGATLPRSVMSVGGRFGYEDQGQTANSQVTVFDYGETKLLFEVRGLPSRSPFPGQGDKPIPEKPVNHVGNTFHFEQGVVANNQFFPKGKEDKPEQLPQVKNMDALKRGPGGGDHFANFIAAMRTRKIEDLNADILEGHYSSALCHLANLSYRVGAGAPLTEKTTVAGDDVATEALSRLREHLTKDAGLKLEDQKYRVGQKLVLDGKGETFVQNPEANKLLTRDYRKGFEVPEKVG